MTITPNNNQFWLAHFSSNFPTTLQNSNGKNYFLSLLEDPFYNYFTREFSCELKGIDPSTGDANDPWDGFVLDISIHQQCTLSLEFHPNETIYFLNEVYIGNTGDHPILSLLTWSELKAIVKGRKNSTPLLWLLLPLVVGTKKEEGEIKKVLESEIAKFDPPVFKKQDQGEVINLLLTHLITDNLCFLTHKTAGVVCTRSHSFRNLESVGEEKVKEINKLIHLAQKP